MSEAPRAAAAGPISHTIFRLARSHSLLAGRLLREVGLNPGQEMILFLLWDRGPMRLTGIADELGFGDSAGTTRKIQRLERAGYVRRVPDPADGRATLVEPTAAGNSVRPRIEQIWAELERLTVAGLTPAEQATTLAQLHRLEENVAKA
ncbi:MarR family winged helix-turn-helix transcriptional regulator [Actinoplanes palleronii]|uniref:Transcriptional regulator n=1 Tax=Actinoplanes palleronii TaxID=113570 RepID=A0ABQ4B1F9_9ACTN|nr:MarR family transcriptional regulator [Actinoplanes palleronii]GIE64503.1 transcriptional regulator [Actinoplanes palleronii]